MLSYAVFCAQVKAALGDFAYRDDDLDSYLGWWYDRHCQGKVKELLSANIAAKFKLKIYSALSRRQYAQHRNEEGRRGWHDPAYDPRRK